VDELLRLEACTVDLQRRQLQRHDGERETLTEQEYGLLYYMSARPGRTIPRDELLEQVWGYSTRSVTRAIDVAVRRLRQKIEADPAHPRHLVSVRGVGYRFEGSLQGAPLEEPPAWAPAPSGLVGRGAELARAQALLSDPAGRRLVTLTGAPGVGKSRLLKQLQQRAYGSAALQGWTPCYVPLDTALPMEPVALAHAIAQALGRVPSQVTPLAQLAELLRRQGSLLLLLDDADRVVEPLASAIPGWLLAAPELRIVVSSRERLRLVEEVVVELGPLPAPQAVALLRERAEAVRTGWGAREAATLEQIAQRLDCNPLAIELAAARAEVLSPDELLRGLDERFRLLGGVHRARAERQATLYEAIAWSWSLLSGWEQSALAQCSVFSGSFSVAAAAAVVDVTGEPGAPWLLDQIQALVGRSLVERAETGSSQVRFRLAESIRDFARAKALEGGLLEAAATRHRDYYAELGESLLSQVHGTDGGRVLRLLHLDIDNLRTAFEQALGSSADVAARLMLALDTVFALRGPLSERQRLLDLALAASPSAPLRARLLLCRARVTALQGERALARQQAQEALGLAEQAGEPAALRYAWLTLGELCAQSGDLPSALAHAERSAQHAAAAGESWLEARAVRLLALVHDDLGQIEELGQDSERLLLLAQQTGDPILRVTALHQSGRHAIARGRYALALTRLAEAQKLAQELGDRHRELPVLMDLSRASLLAGELTDGLERLQEARELARVLGHQLQVLRAEANIGVVLALLDRGEEAVAPLERSLSGALGRAGEGGRRIGLALAHWQCGRLAVAQDLLQEAAEVARSQQAELCAARAHAYAAMVAAERGELASFERHAQQAEPLAAHGPAGGFVQAVGGYRLVLQGDREGARRTLLLLERLQVAGPVYSARTELVIGAELALAARRLRRFLG
jgi:predicted ATPase/DNA-binding winged helix-turn-helix (wHTH) protein